MSSGGQGVVQSPQHQMSMGAPQQQQEMYMTGVHMNGGMGSEYQGGSSVSANVQSQVSIWSCRETADSPNLPAVLRSTYTKHSVTVHVAWRAAIAWLDDLCN